MCLIFHCWTPFWWALMLLLSAPTAWLYVHGMRVPHHWSLSWSCDAGGFSTIGSSSFDTWGTWRCPQLCTEPVNWVSAVTCRTVSMPLWAVEPSCLLCPAGGDQAQVEEGVCEWAQECALPLDWDQPEFVVLQRPALISLLSRSSWSSCINRSRCHVRGCSGP